MRYAKINTDRTDILEWRNLKSPKLLVMKDGSKKLNPKHVDFIDAGWCLEEVPIGFTEFQNLNSPMILTSIIIYNPTYKTLDECKEILYNHVENRAINLIDSIEAQANRYALAEKNLFGRFIEKYRLNDSTYFDVMGGSSMDGATFMSECIKPNLVLEYFIKKVIGIRTDYKFNIKSLLTSVACENFDYLSNWDEAKDLGDVSAEFIADQVSVNTWSKIKDIFINVFNDPALK